MTQQREYMQNHKSKEKPMWYGAFLLVNESDKAYLLCDGTGLVKMHHPV